MFSGSKSKSLCLCETQYSKSYSPCWINSLFSSHTTYKIYYSHAEKAYTNKTVSI